MHIVGQILASPGACGNGRTFIVVHAESDAATPHVLVDRSQDATRQEPLHKVRKDIWLARVARHNPLARASLGIDMRCSNLRANTTSRSTERAYLKYREGG